MVHHKSRIKVQNNKEMENMHNSLNLELFCTYSKKRNLRSGEGERRLLGTTIFTSKFHNAVILNWLRWFLFWSCGFRGKMWICWFRSDCEALQQALDVLQDWSMHNGWRTPWTSLELIWCLCSIYLRFGKGLACFLHQKGTDWPNGIGCSSPTNSAPWEAALNVGM